MSVLFIGLGNMGGPMAVNLVKAGFAVNVFDLNAAVVAECVSQGAVAVADLTAAASQADVVISMLPAGKHVKSVFLGSDQQAGLVKVLKPNALVIDSSTIDAQSARTVGAELAKAQVCFIDAPVSGGTAGAKAGTLTFIVGGAEADFQAAQPYLSAMGKNIFHAGAIGAGQVAKICNNMLLSVLMVGTSEALKMGMDHGLDPAVLSEIMQKSSGNNWVLEKYNPCPGVQATVPSSNGYQGGFMVDLMTKDLGLAMEASLQSQSSTPMGALARSLYVNQQKAGKGKLDFSSIFQQFGNEE